MLERLRSQLVAGHIDLNPSAAVLKLEKGRLAEIAARHDPSADPVNNRLFFERVFIVGSMLRSNCGRLIGDLEIIGKRVDPGGLQILDFGAPLREQFVAFFHTFRFLGY